MIIYIFGVFQCTPTNRKHIIIIQTVPEHSNSKAFLLETEWR